MFNQLTSNSRANIVPDRYPTFPALEGWLSKLPSDTLSGLLANWQAGDNEGLRTVFPLLYGELRRLAHNYLRRERADHTLQSAALVHEAYLRLAKQGNNEFENREHFLATCAQLMRQILIQSARGKKAAKRHGGYRITLDEGLADKNPSIDLVALDDALIELTKLDRQQGHIVELRYFGGLSIEETSHVLGLSPATVKRHWATARLWLHHQISIAPDA